MASTYILYNPGAGATDDGNNISELDVIFDGNLQYLNITKITNYAAFLAGIETNARLVLAGGDGTLNRFVNDTAGLEIRQEIWYYPTGTGNDFALDLGKEKWSDPFPISEYLKNLPSVEVNGKTFRFLNGVGYGIDGYCCEVGDELRKIPGQTVNYTAIAVKGLLFHYKPTRATIMVDNMLHCYDKVWLAPTMHGRFYGGGMMPTPEQKRSNPDTPLSVMVFHGCGKLRTLTLFPSIFKGTHVKHRRFVDILEGHEITVEFDRPTALQIDGETILGVTSYTSRSASLTKEKIRYVR